MWWLSHPFRTVYFLEMHARRRRDRGAVTALVAVLFAGGAILGMLALTVDVGNITLERRQLQNGAEAAAMALAQACASTPPSADCVSPASSSLGALAAKNSFTRPSGVAQQQAISSVCGVNVPGLPLPTCKAPFGYAPDIAECLPLPPWVKPGTAYFEARTVTSTNARDSSPLTSFFAKPLAALFGQTYTENAYKSCARAASGSAGSTGNTLPVVVAFCTWQQGTANGKYFAPRPPYSPAPVIPASNNPKVSVPANVNVPVDPSVPAGSDPLVYQYFPIMVGTHESGIQDNCGKDPNGQTYPGGFSWVQTVDGTCTARFDSSGTVLVGDTGGAPPQDCKKSALAAYVGTEVYVPVGLTWKTCIDPASGKSVNCYTIDGIASFFLAGYSAVPTTGGQGASSYTEPSYVCVSVTKDPKKCNGSIQYLWGWFTSGIKPVGSVDPGGTPRGGNSVAPAG